MRLLIVPFILVGLLVQIPMTVLGSTNQQAADKIADVIGKQFPDADVTVEYKGGQVWLKGEAGSQTQRKQIVNWVSSIPGVNVTEVKEEIRVVASDPVAATPASTPIARSKVSPAVVAPVPVPSTARPQVATATNNTRQTMPVQMELTTQRAPQPPGQQPQMQQQQAQVQQQRAVQPQQAQMPAQTWAGAVLATHPYAHYPAAYGVPGQQPPAGAPFVPVTYAQHPQTAQMSGTPQEIPPHAQQHQPAYYGAHAQAAYHPEAYGPQGPLPGYYNQPYLPDYAWPAYASYPNYAQVSYPRNYSPKAWPYIGPFYPYPQVPMGWRKVTLEHNNGSWWLDFDDGTPSGPFSGLLRQPVRYTY